MTVPGAFLVVGYQVSRLFRIAKCLLDIASTTHLYPVKMRLPPCLSNHTKTPRLLSIYSPRANTIPRTKMAVTLTPAATALRNGAQPKRSDGYKPATQHSTRTASQKGNLRSSSHTNKRRLTTASARRSSSGSSPGRPLLALLFLCLATDDDTPPPLASVTRASSKPRICSDFIVGVWLIVWFTQDKSDTKNKKK